MSATLKRTLFWGAIGIILAASIVWSVRPRPIPVDLMTIDSAPLVVTVDEEGKTRVRDVFVVSAPVMGRARRSALAVGDRVEVGRTIVVEIEPNDPAFLDERARAEASAEVSAAEAALALAKTEVDQAQAELDYAEAQLTRARRLAFNDNISAQAVDDALRVSRTRRAVLATAKASVRVAEHALVRARSRLTSPVGAESRRGTCDCLQLKAPVSGAVLELQHESEAVVNPGDPLVSIGDPSDLEIVAEMLSTDAVRVRPDMRVIIADWGGEKPLDGHVERVEPFGFTKVSALGIEEQRVNVIIRLDGDADTWGNLGHGFRVDIGVVVWEAPDVVTVPVTALFADADAWAVYVRTSDGLAAKRSVAIGARAGLRAEVKRGLEVGDEVVVSPSERIRDGVAIEPRTLR